MIRVTAEIIPQGNEAKKRTLGTIEISNDGTGDVETGNYHGALFAEYTPKDGRHGHIDGFNRQKQSVWSLVGAFLKLWGHTKRTMPATTLTALETRLLVDCAYWRARVAGVSLFRDLPPIVRAVLDECKIPGLGTDEESKAVIKELQLKMLFNPPALPEAEAITTEDPFFN